MGLPKKFEYCALNFFGQFFFALEKEDKNRNPKSFLIILNLAMSIESVAAQIVPYTAQHFV